ncbi:MAG: hypothetical protein OFPI_42420 [Osedax symbiont Rs2]|nr:MAG: hypothetical protein OFPI_42420 [Osedax symbiont Rs2]
MGHWLIDLSLRPQWQLAIIIIINQYPDLLQKNHSSSGCLRRHYFKEHAL